MTLSKAFKKIRLKALLRERVISIIMHRFYKFYKGYDEFEEMLLDSQYNRMKEFNKFFISSETVKTQKPETQLEKERIMKNVDELYKKYYNAYKSNYNTDGELNEAK